MKIRVQPWFTDSCVVFLNNLFKWYPKCIGQQVTVLEWGGGNSTIYFLNKGCRIMTVESDDAYIDDLLKVSRGLGFKATATSDPQDIAVRLTEYDLIIVKATKFEEVGEAIIRLQDWAIIVNDGISRKAVLEAIARRSCPSIVILDNVEYCANWGKLERCAAHPDRVKSYRHILRDPDWIFYLFEQAEGREGHSSPDFTGWEAPHRWISGVLWRRDHLLAKLIVSHLGFPTVTVEGIDDADVATLPERCPFDWNQMKWLIEEYTNVFTLPRKFD